MGLLALGTPYQWSNAQLHADQVRRRGVHQFLNLWNKLKSRIGDRPLWGDEIEYFIISLDHQSQNALLSLSQLEILAALSLDSSIASNLPSSIATEPTFHQEYGRFMLESTPGSPYGSTFEDCLSVEQNMRHRRLLIRDKLSDNQLPITLASFPRLGAPGPFTEPYHPPLGPIAQSLFVPDELINQHIRFPTLTSNIRQRRRSKVAIYVPVYLDSETPNPFKDPTVPAQPPSITIPPSARTDPQELPSSDQPLTNGHKPDHISSTIPIPAVPDNHIYLDAMAFGMGCCCLQTTFQACSVTEARFVYDALVPVAPIMMALSAAAPIFKGFLADVDCRWDVISGAVDDRTGAERDPSSADRAFIPKSRYNSVSLYIADDPLHLPEYDDILAPVDKSVEAELVSKGIDPIMARHVAHLFIRDPLVIFSETVDDPNEDSTEHFENLQSTNWQSVRFKPPPSSSSTIGWRVEFRTMEVQLTDFENAAYAVFVVLLTRTILSFRLNFYLPISKVDENMRRAQQRDACRTGKFYFRTQIYPSASSPKAKQDPPSRLHSAPPLNGVEKEYAELTMDEIMHGQSASGFPGLIVLVRMYMDSQGVGGGVKERLEKYLELISGRACGKLVTPATYIRDFVRKHPAYRNDSVVGTQIVYDLVRHADEVERGKASAEELLGKYYQPVPL